LTVLVQGLAYSRTSLRDGKQSMDTVGEKMHHKANLLTVEPCWVDIFTIKKNTLIST
jgi:hypothetical protein